VTIGLCTSRISEGHAPTFDDEVDDALGAPPNLNCLSSSSSISVGARSQTLDGPKNEYPFDDLAKNSADPASITAIARLGNLGYQKFQYALLSGASLGPEAGAVHGIAECGLHANQEDRGSPMLAAMRGILPR
jgi:hypothetical protein